MRAALRAVAIAAFALALLGGLAAAALAQTAGSSTTASGPAAPATTTQTDPNAAVPVPRMDKRPAGYRRTGFEVQKIAERNPVYRKEHAKFRGSFPNVYTKGSGPLAGQPVQPGREARRRSPRSTSTTRRAA